jgi:hypothetical protein
MALNFSQQFVAVQSELRLEEVDRVANIEGIAAWRKIFIDWIRNEHQLLNRCRAIA